MHRLLRSLAVAAGLAIALAGCQATPGPASTRMSANLAPASMPSKNGGKTYFIEFASRYALSYGHAFVVFGRVNRAGKPIQQEVAGLAPASEDEGVYMAGHVVPVSATTGESDGDLEAQYRTATWRVMLTKEEYDEVVAEIRKLQESSPVWHAALYNCNAFVGSVARSMGYRTPFIWLAPQDYITRLREMNGGKDAIGFTRQPDAAKKDDAPTS